MKTKQKSTLEGENRADVGASTPVEPKPEQHHHNTARSYDIP
mgnify:CR=1 FL=1